MKQLTMTPRFDLEDERMAEQLRALAHPARLMIVDLLATRGTCVCGEIVQGLPLAQATVSQHLKVLKDAGLIRGEIDGPRVGYCIEPRTMRRLKSLVGSL